jgi:radical SAM superfamily enzyme YgiQ (UPF0313 family)
MRVLLVSANREQHPSPVVPIGVLYVASALRDRHEIKVVDLCFEAEPAVVLREAIAKFQPEVVGLGLRNLHDSTYASSDGILSYYDEVARTIRDATAAPLVLGGAAVTLRPKQLAERLGAAHAVVGEGEGTFRALVDALERGERPETVLHAPPARAALLGIRKGRDAFADLDALLPPARDLADPRYFAFDGTSSVQTKRGCAFQCTYCDYPDLEGRKVRVRAPAAVADDFERAASTPGVTHLFVVDSVFNVPRSHALAVSDELVARGSPIPWVAYVTPASFDERLAERMAKAGCVGVEIGTDSGTPRVLERLAKPFSLDQVKRARNALRAAGIADCHTFVLGAEDETLEEAERTLDFVEELDPDIAVFVVFMEDREDRVTGHASARDEILKMLARRCLTRPGLIVPELGIRYGPKVASLVRGRNLRGPAWVHLARARRPRAAS